MDRIGFITMEVNLFEETVIYDAQFTRDDTATYVSTWSATYAIAYNEPAKSCRVIVSAANITYSGRHVKITFNASPSGPVQIYHASIMERSGTTSNGASAPVELKFSGSSGTTIASGSTKTSDATAFIIDETKDYLVTIDYATGYLPYNGDRGIETTYIEPGVATWNVQNYTYNYGTTNQIGFTDISVLIPDPP
jgi:hypothetical protein